MATQEFYIRSASETEARGPFSVEQLVSLAEAGQVTAETLYYDAGNEQWLVLGDNAEIKALIFPEKKKLTIKKDPKIATLNKESTDTQAQISVHDMLAAAEGKTEDTQDKSAGLVMADRCAKAGTWGCIAMLIIAAAAEILPLIEVLTKFSLSGLLGAPLVILGLLDVFLAVVLMLGVVSMYPFVRFRAMLGIGFLGFLFWTQGQSTPLLAAVAGSIGLYFSTVFMSYATLGIALVLGLGGMGGLAYFLFA
ncbi:MAG: DUF4339 domain-containing protein [Opitutae bacterium]|nr:DUF4339 domain-containing protein [Opitutae bacterium]